MTTCLLRASRNFASLRPDVRIQSRMKLLMIDNYDSFTYNIVQYFGELGAEVEVHRNDEITLDADRRAHRRGRRRGW